MQKYRVSFPGEKEYRYLDRAGVEAHFPEINMRIFINMELTALILIPEKGRMMTIRKEDYSNENIPLSLPVVYVNPQSVIISSPEYNVLQVTPHLSSSVTIAYRFSRYLLPHCLLRCRS